MVHPHTPELARKLPPPARILIYDFADQGVAVHEYQGIMRQQPAIRDPQERERRMIKAVQETLAVQLTEGLRELGFTVERAARGSSTGNDVVIDGRFLVIDEGNPLRRLVVGFGAGAAKLETRVAVIDARTRKDLLALTTRTDSGKLPGAAATIPAAAALPPGLSLGVTAGGAVAKSVNEKSSNLEQLAVASAEQTIRSLSQYFSRWGWLRQAGTEHPHGTARQPSRFAGTPGL